MADPVPDPPADPGAYPYRTTVQLRWKDNDVYGHVNNAEYYSYLDSVINELLIERGGLDILEGRVIGLCAESHCRFLGPLSYPGTVEACLRVGHLGSSSVRYELALFDEGGQCSAVGWFVHVFVDRDSRRPAEIGGRMRELLESLEAAG